MTSVVSVAQVVVVVDEGGEAKVVALGSSVKPVLWKWQKKPRTEDVAVLVRRKKSTCGDDVVE